MTGTNTFRSKNIQNNSGNYINNKRQKTTYREILNNNFRNVEYTHFTNGGSNSHNLQRSGGNNIIALRSVGGPGVYSQSRRLDIARGRAFSESLFINNELTSTVIEQPNPTCQKNGNIVKTKPRQLVNLNLDMNNANFLTNRIRNSCQEKIKDRLQFNNRFIFTPNLNLSTRILLNNDPLSNLNLNTKLEVGEENCVKINIIMPEKYFPTRPEHIVPIKYFPQREVAINLPTSIFPTRQKHDVPIIYFPRTADKQIPYQDFPRKRKIELPNNHFPQKKQIIIPNQSFPRKRKLEIPEEYFPKREFIIPNELFPFKPEIKIAISNFPIKRPIEIPDKYYYYVRELIIPNESFPLKPEIQLMNGLFPTKPEITLPENYFGNFVHEPLRMLSLSFIKDNSVIKSFVNKIESNSHYTDIYSIPKIYDIVLDNSGYYSNYWIPSSNKLNSNEVSNNLINFNKIRTINDLNYEPNRTIVTPQSILYENPNSIISYQKDNNGEEFIRINRSLNFDPYWLNTTDYNRTFFNNYNSITYFENNDISNIRILDNSRNENISVRKDTGIILYYTDSSYLQFMINFGNFLYFDSSINSIAWYSNMNSVIVDTIHKLDSNINEITDLSGQYGIVFDNNIFDISLSSQLKNNLIELGIVTIDSHSSSQSTSITKSKINNIDYFNINLRDNLDYPITLTFRKINNFHRETPYNPLNLRMSALTPVIDNSRNLLINSIYKIETIESNIIESKIIKYSIYGQPLRDNEYITEIIFNLQNVTQISNDNSFNFTMSDNYNFIYDSSNRRTIMYSQDSYNSSFFYIQYEYHNTFIYLIQNFNNSDIWNNIELLKNEEFYTRTKDNINVYINQTIYQSIPLENAFLLDLESSENYIFIEQKIANEKRNENLVIKGNLLLENNNVNNCNFIILGNLTINNVEINNSIFRVFGNLFINNSIINHTQITSNQISILFNNNLYNFTLISKIAIYLSYNDSFISKYESEYIEEQLVPSYFTIPRSLPDNFHGPLNIIEEYASISVYHKYLDVLNEINLPWLNNRELTLEYASIMKNHWYNYYFFVQNNISLDLIQQPTPLFIVSVSNDEITSLAYLPKISHENNRILIGEIIITANRFYIKKIIGLEYNNLPIDLSEDFGYFVYYSQPELPELDIIFDYLNLKLDLSKIIYYLDNLI